MNGPHLPWAAATNWTLIALGYPDAASETIEVIGEIAKRGIVRKTKAYGLRHHHRLLTVILSVKVRYATVER